jgi:adenylylsulfate kinase
VPTTPHSLSSPTIARRGEIQYFNGISSPYEEPHNPELVVETDLQSTEDIVEEIMAELAQRGIFG